MSLSLINTNMITGRLPLDNFVQASTGSILLGRGSVSGEGSFQEINLGAGFSMSGTTLSITGGGGGGKLAQFVRTEDSTVKSTMAIIPSDNTVPQNTEGAEYTELATTITPTNASSQLFIIVDLWLSVENSNSIVLALFRDSDASAIPGGVGVHTVANYWNMHKVSFSAAVVAGSTSPTTIKLRWGMPGGSYPVRINSATGAALFGGSMKSAMTIIEISP